MLEQQTTGQQVRSRQSKNLGGYDKAVSQTMPALNSRENGSGGISGSAYGNIIGSYANAPTTSSGQGGNTG